MSFVSRQLKGATEGEDSVNAVVPISIKPEEMSYSESQQPPPPDVEGNPNNNNVDNNNAHQEKFKSIGYKIDTAMTNFFEG